MKAEDEKKARLSLVALRKEEFTSTRQIKMLHEEIRYVLPGSTDYHLENFLTRFNSWVTQASEARKCYASGWNIIVIAEVFEFLYILGRVGLLSST